MNYKNLIRLLAAIVPILAIISCENNSENQNNWQYLVSYEETGTQSLETSKAILGTLITKDPGAEDLITAAEYNVKTYRVTYKSTLKNQTIIASGVVCIPDQNGDYPMLNFLNGTNTAHFSAPSVNTNNLLFLYIKALASNGYILLIPDYPGFGSTSDKLHPYFLKEETTPSVIDLLYASRELLSQPEIQASFNNNTFLMGYSQGGWVTLATLAEIEKSHSEIHVLAASCGAGAYNLQDVSNFIISQETFPSPLYLPFYVHSHNTYGTFNYPLTKIFKEPYAQKIPNLFDGSKSNNAVNQELNDTIQKLLTPDFINNLVNGADYEAFRDDLIQNSVPAWKTNVKIRFYHGSIDNNVPSSDSKKTAAAFKEIEPSSQVEYIEMEGKDHTTGAEPWGIQSVLWFNTLK